MSNTIKLKRGSGSDPGTSDLVVGEVALRTDTGQLFTKKDDGNIEEIGAQAGVSDGDKGDITVSNSGATFTIDNNAVTTAKMADMPTGRILGREASGTGDPQYLTATEARSVLNVENGATADQTASEIVALIADQTIAPSTIDMEDDEKIKLGTSDDLLIYHSGSQSYIQDAGTGQLRVLSNQFRVHNAADTETMIAAFQEGAVKLMYDNTTRIETTSDGASVTGNITVSGTVDGRDLATDGTKLDGIESNATADQTASEILTLLKTVDGSGSGLVAERLTLTNQAGDSSCSVLFAQSATGDQLPHTNANLTFDATNGTLTAQNLIVSGDLTVSGTTTTIDTSTLTVEDKNIELGKVSTPSDTTADGGGITLKGATDKTFNWIDSTDSWTSSEHIALPDSKKLQVGSSQDLQIYHNGTDTYIDNTNGELFIKTTTKFNLRSDNNEAMIVATPNGAVELKYDNNTKLETTSGGVTVTGNVFVTGNFRGDDNSKLDLGNSNDLQIYHDGSHSYVAHDGTGALRVRGDLVQITDIAGGGGGDSMATFTSGGAVQLYYDGALKAETRSDGFEIKQHLTMGDSDEIRLGNSSDLKIYHDGSHSRIVDSGTGHLIIQTSELDLMNAAGNEDMIKATQNGAVELYHDNSKKFETTSGGVLIANGNVSSVPAGNGTASGASLDTTGGDIFTGRVFIQGDNKSADSDFLTGINNNGSQLVFYDYSNTEHLLKFNKNGSTELNHNGSKKFETTSYGALVTGTMSAGSGNFDVADNGKFKAGNSSDLQIYHDGTHSYITNSADVNTFYIQTYGQNAIKCIAQQSVELYENGTMVAETTAGGFNVEGVTYSNGLDMDDNHKILLGTGDDLEIYHSGSHSFIKDSGTGNLQIWTNQLSLVDSGGSEAIIQAVANGQVELYYDNVRKLETTNTGVTVTGTTTSNYLTLSAVNPSVTFTDTNNNPDFKLEVNSGQFKIIDSTNSADRLIVQSDGQVDIGGMQFYTSNNVAIPVDGARFKLGANDDFGIRHDAGGPTIFDDANNQGVKFQFKELNITEYTGTTTKVKLDTNGNVGIGTASISDDADHCKLAISGQSSTAAGILVFQDTSQNEDGAVFADNGNLYIVADRANATSNSSIIFRVDGSSQKMRLDSSGNLEVTGNVDCNGIRMGDNDEIRLGAGDDLKIYHDGNQSIINDNGTGDLKIRQGGSDRITITSAGATVSGELTISSALPAINLTDTNNDSDYQIKNGNGDFNIKDVTNNANRLTIASDGTTTINGGVVNLGTADSSSGHLNSFEVMTFNIDTDNDDTNRYFAFYKNGASGSGTELFKIDESGELTISGSLGIGTSGSPGRKLHIQDSSDFGIRLTKTGSSDAEVKNTNSLDLCCSSGGSSGQVIRMLTGANTSSLVEGLRMDGSRKVLIGMNSQLITSPNNPRVQIYQQMGLRAADNGNSRTCLVFQNPAGRQGFININASGIVIVGTSDYRVKDDINYSIEGITKIKQVKPCTFKFKADEENLTVHGFIAHELQEVIPEAVTGEKDEVVTQAKIDAGEYEQETLGDEIHQGVDASKLVPLLTKALQEIISKVEVLETEVAALKAV